MARNDTPKGKIVRRFGINIFGNEKYDRLLARKPNGPGKDPGRRTRVKESEYRKQLTEKQKLKYTYGLTERQMRNIYLKTKRQKGRTGELMLSILESRIDNIVYRGGFAATRPQARQLVTHGLLRLNGRGVDVPSINLVPGDVISLRPGKVILDLIRGNLNRQNRPLKPWLKRDENELTLELTSKTLADPLEMQANMQLVVEYYAR